jgi:hypothetical protein
MSTIVDVDSVPEAPSPAADAATWQPKHGYGVKSGSGYIVHHLPGEVHLMIALQLDMAAAGVVLREADAEHARHVERCRAAILRSREFSAWSMSSGFTKRAAAALASLSAKIAENEGKVERLTGGEFSDDESADVAGLLSKLRQDRQHLEDSRSDFDVQQLRTNQLLLALHKQAKLLVNQQNESFEAELSQRETNLCGLLDGDTAAFSSMLVIAHLRNLLLSGGSRIPDLLITELCGGLPSPAQRAEPAVTGSTLPAGAFPGFCFNVP